MKALLARLAPKTLLGRTVLILAVVLIASQLLAVQLFRIYAAGPLFRQIGGLVTVQLHTLRAALETLPEAEREEFLAALEETENIRVIPDTATGLSANIPRSPQLKDFADYLKRQLGPDTEFFMQEEGGRALWVRMSIGGNRFWVSIPRQQLERPPPWLWLGWMGACAVLVLAGAYLVVRRVNQPLGALAAAARQLGAGRTPEPLAERGPAEVRAVSHAFNQMAADIRAHDEERALLLAGISHDLRTPLARIRMIAEIAADKLDDDLREGLVADIEEMDGIIQQFLDFARAAADEPAQPTDLNGLVEAQARRQAALGRQVEVDTTPLPAIALRPQAITRLLGNLVGNALAYGGGQVLLRTRAEANAVVLAVLDRGPGIPPEQAERLKQPFTRLNPARSNAGHAGLGLAIVQRIAELHGASFDLLPRAGGGLEARLAFPAGAGDGSHAHA